ncbi:MAG TPA: FAD-binding oxidoreductase [Candidatus Limnocylindria bacterium]|nr:FAD-binding oxidoreductase [Candidatus Limnocylindria bacterium]
MSVVWGTPPWDTGAPRLRPALPSRCDVAVIGAGLTGLSAAYHLARRGADVVVLEAERVGAGASGHTGAIALEGTSIGPLAGADDCLAVLARVASEAGIACDLDLRGCWELEHRPPAPDATPLWRDGDGHLYVARTEPGGTLDVGALLRGLARAAAEAGARIAEGVPVLPLVAGHPLRLAGGETLAARCVIVATESLTRDLVPLPEVSAALTLALATEPLAEQTIAAIGLAERRPFYTADLPYLWGRLLADGRLVVGAGLVFPDDGDVRRVSVDDPAARAALARLEARLRGLHPALGTVGVSARWGGPVAFRRSAGPIFAWHPALPGVLVTGAYAGHGVALSVCLGKRAAAAAIDGQPLPDWGRIG